MNIFNEANPIRATLPDAAAINALPHDRRGHWRARLRGCAVLLSGKLYSFLSHPVVCPCC